MTRPTTPRGCATWAATLIATATWSAATATALVYITHTWPGVQPLAWTQAVRIAAAVAVVASLWGWVRSVGREEP